MDRRPCPIGYSTKAITPSPRRPTSSAASTTRRDGYDQGPSAAAARAAPAALTGCRSLDDAGLTTSREWTEDGGTVWTTSSDDRVLQEEGQPLEGLLEMTPTEAEDALRRSGLCYRFDYQTPSGFDRRCSAPETGEIVEAWLGPDAPADDADAIVYIVVRDDDATNLPEPPPYGTDCPSQ